MLDAAFLIFDLLTNLLKLLEGLLIFTFEFLRTLRVLCFNLAKASLVFFGLFYQFKLKLMDLVLILLLHSVSFCFHFIRVLPLLVQFLMKLLVLKIQLSVHVSLSLDDLLQLVYVLAE